MLRLRENLQQNNYSVNFSQGWKQRRNMRCLQCNAQRLWHDDKLQPHLSQQEQTFTIFLENNQVFLQALQNKCEVQLRQRALLKSDTSESATTQETHKTAKRWAGKKANRTKKEAICKRAGNRLVFQKNHPRVKKLSGVFCCRAQTTERFRLIQLSLHRHFTIRKF